MGSAMLEDIYFEKNNKRTHPCVQSRNDPFRIVHYDVTTAAEYTMHTQPLLMKRHNVVPGMFLVRTQFTQLPFPYLVYTGCPPILVFLRFFWPSRSFPSFFLKFPSYSYFLLRHKLCQTSITLKQIVGKESPVKHFSSHRIQGCRVDTTNIGRPGCKLAAI